MFVTRGGKSDTPRAVNYTTQSKPSGEGRSSEELPVAPDGTDPLNVYVVDLPLHYTKSQLQAIYEPFGNLISCTVLCDGNTGVSRGIGFARFSDRDSAARALKDTQGMMLEGASKPILVRFARDTSRKSDDPPNQHSGPHIPYPYSYPPYTYPYAPMPGAPYAPYSYPPFPHYDTNHASSTASRGSESEGTNPSPYPYYPPPLGYPYPPAPNVAPPPGSILPYATSYAMPPIPSPLAYAQYAPPYQTGGRTPSNHK